MALITDSPASQSHEAEVFRPRTPREYLGILLRGFAMGAADVVPGVSGGTMAFILGIYEELILSIRAIARPAFWRALLRFRVQDALNESNFLFLASLGAGVLLAVFTLAQGLEWMLTNHPVILWSFFFGLVLASVWSVSKRIPRWTLPLLLVLAVGAIGAYVLVGLVPVQTPNSWWFLFLSGALAICAMILPGISGAFILLLLGKYQHVLGAVNDRDFITVGLVGVGAVVGLISFAQVLSWLFKRYHDLTVALLIGFMVGSLRKIWPWKEVVQTITDHHGEVIPVVERNVLPPSFDLYFLVAAGLLLLGFITVLLIERLAEPEVKPGT